MPLYSNYAKYVLALLPLPLLVIGCASIQDLFENGDAGRPLVDAAERPSRIVTLEASIEEDHDTLEALVSGQREDADGPLHKNKDLRAIAERLSENEEELEALLRAEKLVR